METNLKPNYSPILTKHIEIIFIPFGKSWETSGPEKFQCQHGPEECNLNKIMSCALYFLYEQEKQEKFIVCAMKLRDQWIEVTFQIFLSQNISFKLIFLKVC